MLLAFSFAGFGALFRFMLQLFPQARLFASRVMERRPSCLTFMARFLGGVEFVQSSLGGFHGYMPFDLSSSVRLCFIGGNDYKPGEFIGY